MKKLILSTVLAVIFTGGLCFAHDEKKEPQKFNVTITVEFEAMSLKEIANKEEKLQKLIGDADVIVEFEKNCPTCNNNLWFRNNMPSNVPN